MTFASRLRGQRQARLSLHCAERLPQRDAGRPITTSAPRPAAAARAAHPQPARSTAAHRPRADPPQAERMRRFGVRAQGVEMAVGSELLVGAHAARDIMPHAIPCRAGCGILCHAGRHGCQFCGARCAARGAAICFVLYNCTTSCAAAIACCRSGYHVARDIVPCGMPCHARRPALRRSPAVARATALTNVRGTLRPQLRATPSTGSGRKLGIGRRAVGAMEACRHAAARAWRHAAHRSEQGKGCAWWRWQRQGGCICVCV